MSSISTPTDYSTYFEKIARQHLSIGHTASHKHFITCDIDALQEQIKGLEFPALILEWYDGGYHDEQNDNVIKTKIAAFVIGTRLATRNVPADLNALMTSMELIGHDIMARVRDEFQNSMATSPAGFNLNHVIYHKVGPINDFFYGWRFQFPIWTPAENQFLPDSSKWNYTL